MEELFKKVYLKTEEDLPKEEDKYIVLNKKNGNLVRYYYYDNDKCKQKWLQKVNWYFQLIEQETQQKTTEKIEIPDEKIIEAINWCSERGFTIDDVPVMLAEYAQQQQKPEQSVQSVEEILEDYCGYITIPFDENVTVYYPTLIEAMESYASQFKGQKQQIQFPTDLDIQRWAIDKVNEIDPDEYGYGDLLIEGAEWCREWMKSQIKSKP